MPLPGRIAWIEDDILIIDPVVYQLERAGHQIDRYTTYARALDNREIILRSDLILLDLILPPGSSVVSEGHPYLGLRLIRDFHTLAQANALTVPPVLILSAVVTRDLIGNFTKEFEGKIKIEHLRKPTLPSTLKERVEALIRSERV